jgi:hypothetical protein
MTNGPKDGPEPASDAITRQLPVSGTGADQLWERVPLTPIPPPGGFTLVEGPTLSSPSSDPQPTTLVGLESRVQNLEQHIESIERELGEIVGAVEHLLRGQESVERSLRQQRYSRYVLWGTLLAILGVLWMTLRSRLGLASPN